MKSSSLLPNFKRLISLRLSGALAICVAVAMGSHAGPAPTQPLGNLSYPAKGNIQWDEGTLEMWVVSGFESDKTKWPNRPTLFTISLPADHSQYQIFFVTDCIAEGGGPPLRQTYSWAPIGEGPPKGMFWKPGEMHHLAWTWHGRDRSLYIDGKAGGVGFKAPIKVIQTVEGNLHGDLTTAMLNFGTHTSPLVLAGVQISSVAKTGEEINQSMKTGPKKDNYTLLLDRCDGGPAEVISGYSGETGGTWDGPHQKATTPFGQGMQLWAE